MKCRILLLVCLTAFSVRAMAQDALKWSVSTNLADWAYLVTFNVSGQYALARHFSLEAQARWNPWAFGDWQQNALQSKQRTVSIGTRWWPWYTYSGWWVGARGQYQEYNSGGFKARDTEEGDAFGLVMSGGYSLQLAKWLNLDFGLGFWGGYSKYRTYACPNCGRLTGGGEKTFFLPDEMMISAMLIF